MQYIFKFSLLSMLLALLPYGSLAQSADTNAPKPADILAKNTATAGDLLVTPTRVVFSGRNRSTELILKNQGNKATTYRLSLMDLDINAKGEMSPTETYANTAKNFIRFSPRQVTLEPGSMQKVKLLLRKPKDLGTGEYRSHLKFQALPDDSIGENIEPTQVAEGVSIKLIPLIGLSIPVIAQHGDLPMSAKMKASMSADTMNVTISRSGNRSVFGDVYIKRNDDVIATASTSIVLPMTTRNIAISLPQNTSKEGLTIEFVEAGSEDGTKLASYRF